jgi:dTDP-4-amino-4,6-dideoxygalactose transaminase
MTVPFLDLKTQYKTLEPEILSKVTEILRSGSYVNGPYVAEFEEAFAKSHQIAHCLSANNGTSALHVALWASGILPGDEVLVPANTFIATAEAVVLCGARPVFVDHDDYYNIDPQSLETKITDRTKALIAVHLYGQPAQMDALRQLCNRHRLLLIEDAAQAHLASDGGKLIGSWGDATCFSFYPGKNLGAYGEGGAVITNDDELHRRMKLLRDHGSESKYQHIVSGHNYRLEALQAGILTVKLQYLPKWTEGRRRVAGLYSESLKDIAGIRIPRVRQGVNPVWHLYVVLAQRRDQLQHYLTERGIGTGLHYPKPLHLQQAYASLGYKPGDFPRSEASAAELLSLPIYPEMTDEQVSYVVKHIREFYS